MLKKILRRITNRLKRTVRLTFMRYIKYNQQYRPLGVKKLSEKNSGIELLELNPPYISTLDLAPKFLEDCSWHSKPVVSVQVPADYIATIKDGRIYASDYNNYAVISGDNYLIAEPSYQWNDARVEPENNVVFKIRGFSKPKKYRGRVFSLLTLGAAKHYYYHWVFDAVAKLRLLKQSGLFNEVDYFLVPNYQYQYNKEYLSQFGIPESKIINEEVEHHIQADHLMVCSFVRNEEHLPKATCDFLYNSFINSIEKQKSKRAIYIARGDAAKSRKVSNKPELMAILRKYGVEIHYLSKISVLEQVKLFNSASVVIGVHGGGFSNLVYCEPGAKVLEIFPDQYVRHYFYDICTKKGLSYDYLLCKSDRIVANHFEGEAVGLTVDLDAIEEKIKLLGLQDTYSRSSSPLHGPVNDSSHNRAIAS
jgi:hypothetical protein